MGAATAVAVAARAHVATVVAKAVARAGATKRPGPKEPAARKAQVAVRTVANALPWRTPSRAAMKAALPTA